MITPLQTSRFSSALPFQSIFLKCSHLSGVYQVEIENTFHWTGLDYVHHIHYAAVCYFSQFVIEKTYTHGARN